MYDELVKRLRDAAKMSEALAVLLPHSEGNVTAKLYNEAADTIEELSKQILEMGQVGKFLLDVHKINSKMVDPESVPTDSEWWSHYKALLELLYLPRWIPVTERLPEKGQYLVAYHPCYWDSVDYDKTLVDIDSYRATKVTPIHKRWAKTKYQRVTHWMPLPEPPKEE